MRRHRAALRFAIASGVVIGVAAVPRVAQADASFALSWRARPGAAACVSEPALRSAVEKKLRRKPFADREHADIVIEGEESSTSGRFRARLTQRDRGGVVLGSRELEAESCAGLLRLTTIVVALVIEPEKDREPDEHAPGETSRDEHAQGSDVVLPERRDQLPVERREEPSRRVSPKTLPARPPFELSLGVGAAAAVGLLPSTSTALRGVARLDHTGSRWSFEWTGGYSLPQTVREGTVRGTFSAVDQQLRACLSLVAEPKVGVDACGGGFWGAILPTTAGVTEGNDAWRPIGGPMGAVAVELREPARAARLELGLIGLPVRRSLYYLTSEAEPARLYSTGRVIVFVGLTGLFTIF